MEEKKFGDRNNQGNYIPKRRVSYPPVFVWPLAPFQALKWIFSIPGYFLPWNLFYVGIGLISWFALSPPLEDYANLTIITFALVFMKNSGLVLRRQDARQDKSFSFLDCKHERKHGKLILRRIDVR